MREIKKDWVLRVYGFFLGCTLVLNWIDWQFFRQSAQGDLLVMILGKEKGFPAICWPFFETCYKYRVLSSTQVQYLLTVFLLMAIATSILFLFKRFYSLAWWLLLGAFIMKVLILVQDFRLRKNQHYMNIIVILIFLFIPKKRQTLQYIIVGFYFFAGLLKLNFEWLSGAAIYNRHRFPLPDLLFVPSMYYVVILELFLSFWLISRSPLKFWFVAINYLIFHWVGYHIVGFYYPLLMIMMMSVFVLVKLDRDDVDYLKLLRMGRASIFSYVTIGVFTLLQLIPVFMSKDSSITGEGRLFSLHMFDAKVICRWGINLRFLQGDRYANFGNDEVPTVVRVRCDPIVVYELAKRQCEKYQFTNGFVDLNIYLVSRKSSDKGDQVVINFHDFCRLRPNYRVLSKNLWILPQQVSHEL